MKTGKNKFVTTTIFFLFFGLFINIGISQETEVDVIYLKNGKTISGTIKERIEDKTVIIETNEGTEFVEMSDVKKIEKELIPRISSINPISGAAGFNVTITGKNFGKKTNTSSVLMGNNAVQLVRWSNTQINFTVPQLALGQYSISVVNGLQKDIAQTQFEVTVPLQLQSENLRRAKIESQPQPQPVYEEPNEENKTAAFIISGSYAKPQKEFAATELDDKSGFAKPGYAIGFEGRIALSDFIYIPIDLQVLNNEINFDEYKNKVNQKYGSSWSISSDVKKYIGVWISGGLGLAIHLSHDTYLFGSYSYGYFGHTFPDYKISSGSAFLNFYSSKANSGGKLYSFGITTDVVTLGYKVVSTNPSFEVKHYDNSFVDKTGDNFELPITLGLFYFGLTF